MTTVQDIGDGEGIPPRKIPRAGSWYVPFRSMVDEIDDCIGHSSAACLHHPSVAFCPTVPIQTRDPPHNVRFEIADVTGVLRFADASVDVVHARMICLSVRFCLETPLPFP